ncbi:hypothetical protein KSP40_PGU018409 [Platanthera guangdongensis]|uniref:Uncharacterized protein n=1 Tax=Platanthera guangdongensis TaxID=2320717 RepID=A0ABR2LVV9_9ASPA
MASPPLKFYFPQALPLLLLFLPIFSSISHVAAQNQESATSGSSDEPNLTASFSSENPPFILAAERTRRVDPLNDYKYYTGGWNITDEHYLATLVFNAARFALISIAWFVGFGLVLVFTCCFSCFCGRRQQHRSNSYSPSWHALSLIILILLACVAIFGCIMLFAGHGKYQNSAMSLLNYAKDQSDFVLENLQDFADKMEGAKNVEVDQVFLPADLQAEVDEISTKLSTSLQLLSSRASKSLSFLAGILNIIKTNLVITTVFMLVLTFLGLLCSLLGMQFLVYFLVIVGWIAVSIMFVLSGSFLIVHTAVGDTCVALDEWAARPQETTSLSDIIPCVDIATANESLSRSKEVTFQLVKVVNGFIVNVSNVNYPPVVVPPPLNYNQSGPRMPRLCNPYRSDLSDRVCRSGEATFDNAAEEWKRFICDTKVVSRNEICSSVGRVTPSIYGEMTNAVSMSQGLYLYVPFLVKIADCALVREAFDTISENFCPSLEHYSRIIYIGLNIETAATMLSLVFWMVLVAQRIERKNCKRSTTQEGPQIAGYKLQEN